MKQKRSLRFSTLLMAFRTVVGVLASYAAISPASASELSAYLRTYAVAYGGSEDEKVLAHYAFRTARPRGH